MGGCCCCESSDCKHLEELVRVHLAFFKKAETFFAANPGEQWIPIAVAQYASFLQERAFNQHKEPPTFAVAWIWHLHLLHPVAYKTYCEFMFLRVISPLPRDMLLGSLEISGIVGVQPLIPLPMIHTGRVATWTDLHLKQKTFFTQTKDFAPTSSQIARLVTKYEKFLQLMKLSTALLVPTPEIDYIWHSCLHDPIFYSHICQLHVGKLINHNDLLEDGFLQEAYRETRALYEREYTDVYEDFNWRTTGLVSWVYGKERDRLK